MPVGGCRVGFLMRTPYYTLDRRRFGMRMIGMLLALSASCFISLSASCFSASNLKPAFLTDERQLSRSEASCCHGHAQLQSTQTATKAWSTRCWSMRIWCGVHIRRTSSLILRCAKKSSKTYLPRFQPLTRCHCPRHQSRAANV